jgi:nucleotide-binding universal stress UspA family protein
MHTLRNLVVGTDFSPSAESALDLAIAMAKVGSAVITLVHVCEPTDEHGFDDARSEDDVLQECATALLAQCTRRAWTGVAIMPVLRSGQIADKIHNVATEVGASLIIVGRTERGRIGPIAERILRNATRPVLVAGIEPLAVKEAP